MSLCIEMKIRSSTYPICKFLSSPLGASASAYVTTRNIDHPEAIKSLGDDKLAVHCRRYPPSDRVAIALEVKSK